MEIKNSHLTESRDMGVLPEIGLASQGRFCLLRADHEAFPLTQKLVRDILLNIVYSRYE